MQVVVYKTCGIAEQPEITPSLHSFAILSLASIKRQFFKMHSATFVAVLAALPSTFACLAYTGGLPKHTGTKSLSAPQYIKKGTTFDAGWVKVC